MEVGMLPISASKRGKLLAAGYTSLLSISSASPSDLARDIEVSDSEASEILKHASRASALEPSNGSRSASVFDGKLWTNYMNTIIVHHRSKWSDSLGYAQTCMTTSCVDLDNILDGGINFKEVTERIQLAVNVQIPQEYGGLGGKAIYIDTEGSFMVERVLQIAEACIEDMSEYSLHFHKDFQAYEGAFLKSTKKRDTR